MASIKVGVVTIEYDKETNQILKMDDGINSMDFTVPDAVHPVKFFYGTNNQIVVKNVYALDQAMAVGIQDNICDLLFEYLKAPAFMYREMHLRSTEASVTKMRSVIASYAFKLSRADSEEIREFVLRVLRCMTIVGNFKVANDLFNATAGDNAPTEFIKVLQPMLTAGHIKTVVTKALEIHFGYINRDALTEKLALDIPITDTQIQEPSLEVAKWALENNLIVPEQYNGLYNSEDGVTA